MAYGLPGRMVAATIGGVKPPVWIRGTSMIATLMFSTALVAPSVAHAQEPRRKVETWPYRRNVPLPRGFHVEERANLPLLITGGVFVGTGASVLVAGLATRRVISSSCRDTNCDNSASNTIAAAGGLFMGVGVVLLLVGLANPRLVVLRGDPPPGSEPVDVSRSWPEPKTEPRLTFGLDSVGTGTGLTFAGAF